MPGLQPCGETCIYHDGFKRSLYVFVCSVALLQWLGNGYLCLNCRSTTDNPFAIAEIRCCWRWAAFNTVCGNRQPCTVVWMGYTLAWEVVFPNIFPFPIPNSWWRQPDSLASASKRFRFVLLYYLQRHRERNESCDECGSVVWVLSRPVTSLGHQRRQRVFWEGPKILNYVQHIFPGGRKNFQEGLSLCAPLVTGLVLSIIFTLCRTDVNCHRIHMKSSRHYVTTETAFCVFSLFYSAFLLINQWVFAKKCCLWW